MHHNAVPNGLVAKRVVLVEVTVDSHVEKPEHEVAANHERAGPPPNLGPRNQLGYSQAW